MVGIEEGGSASHKAWPLMQSRASRIAVVYAVIGSLWIFFSDRVLEWLFAQQSPSLGTEQTVKGLIFIAVTAISLYILLDLAHRRAERTQDALKLSEASLSLVMREATDYVLILLDTQGRVQTWNRGAERIKGYGDEEIIGKSVGVFYTSSDRAAGKPEALLEKARQEGFAVEEGWHVRKNGERFFAHVVVHAARDKNGELFGFVRLTRDVTEKHLEAHRLQLVAQSVELGLSDCDLSEQHMVFSPGWLSHLGFEEGNRTMSVEEWEALVHPDDLAAVRSQIRETINTAPAIGHLEYRCRTRDGAYRTVLAKGRVVLDHQRSPVRMLASHLDITERKEQEARLRRAQRLEAVGQLTGGVAHDFNNLLTVMLGNAELLAERLGRGSEEGKLAQVLQTAADRGAGLANRLLDFVRQDAGEEKEVVPSELIDSLLPLLQRTLGGGIELDTEYPQNEWRITVDPQLLENALINLAANARDAMPDGGHALIRVRNLPLRRELTGSGPRVEIAFQDDGKGMPAAVAAHAFEAFFTTKPPGKGTGLGLAMVSDCARDCGGDAKIDSQEGVGTSIVLSFPAKLPVQPAVPATGLKHISAGHGERLLLVEDDLAVRRLMVDLLESLGYVVTAVESGEAALEKLDRGAPDLVVTDVNLPGQLGGRQLMELIRARLPGVPLLVVSGHFEEMPDYSCVGGPVPLLLNKPFTRRELSNAVRTALDQAVTGAGHRESA